MARYRFKSEFYTDNELFEDNEIPYRKPFNIHDRTQLVSSTPMTEDVMDVIRIVQSLIRASRDWHTFHRGGQQTIKWNNVAITKDNY